MASVQQIYEIVDHVLSLSALSLASLAAVLLLLRINKIIDVVKEISKHSGEISKFRDTLEGMQNLELGSKLTEFQTQLAGVNAKLTESQTQITLVNAKLAESQNKLSDVSDDLSSVFDQLGMMQQTETDDRATESATSSDTEPPRRNDWEKIRDIWSDTRDKLEGLVKRADGRRYRAMTRYDYTDIIEKLAADQLINAAMADDATHMNDTYLSFRNQKMPVTDDVKDDFAKRKSRFDAEFGQYVPASAPAKPADSGQDAADAKRPAFDIDTTMLLPQVRPPGASDGLSGNGRLPH